MKKPKKDRTPPADPRWVPADVLLGQLMAMVGDDSPQSQALVRKLKRERLRGQRRRD